MKYLFIIIILSIAFTPCIAQKQSDIKLMAALESKDSEVITYAKDYLLNKVKDEITRDGYAGISTSRFIVLVHPVITDKQNTGQLILYTYDLQFSVVDLMADKTYNSFVVQIGGAGKSEGQAIMDALRRLDLKTTKLADNLRMATGEIVRYYNANCRSIINKTNVLLASKQYDDAFANLAFIPDLDNLSCKSEYNATLVKVYQQYSAYKCSSAVQDAKTSWNLNPTTEGAQSVAGILSNIQLSNECKGEVNTLITEIKKKLLKDQFDEAAFRNKVFDSHVNLQRDAINASRDIAVEYYKSKLPNVYVYL